MTEQQIITDGTSDIISHFIHFYENNQDIETKESIKRIIAFFVKQQLINLKNTIQIMKFRPWKYSSSTTFQTLKDHLHTNISHLHFIDELKEYFNGIIRSNRLNAINSKKAFITLCNEIEDKISNILQQPSTSVSITSRQKRIEGLNLQEARYEENIKYIEMKNDDEEFKKYIEELGDKIVKIQCENKKLNDKINKLKKENIQLKEQLENQPPIEPFGDRSQYIQKYEFVCQQLEEKETEIINKEKDINELKKQNESLLNTIENLRFEQYTKIANEIVGEQPGVKFTPKLMNAQSKETYTIDLVELENEKIVFAKVSLERNPNKDQTEVETLKGEKVEKSIFDLIKENEYEKPQPWSCIADGKSMVITIIFKTETYDEGMEKWNGLAQKKNEE